VCCWSIQRRAAPESTGRWSVINETRGHILCIYIQVHTTRRRECCARASLSRQWATQRAAVTLAAGGQSRERLSRAQRASGSTARGPAGAADASRLLGLARTPNASADAMRLRGPPVRRDALELHRTVLARSGMQEGADRCSAPLAPTGRRRRLRTRRRGRCST